MKVKPTGKPTILPDGMTITPCNFELTGEESAELDTFEKSLVREPGPRMMIVTDMALAAIKEMAKERRK